VSFNTGYFENQSVRINESIEDPTAQNPVLRIQDPESGAFFIPESGIRNKLSPVSAHISEEIGNNCVG
jgi:hypothetical protein